MEILYYPKDKDALDKKIFFYNSNDDFLLERVGKIINKVILDGDRALCDFAREFDKIEISSKSIRHPLNKGQIDFSNLHPGFNNALDEAIKNITTFHRLQLPQDINYRGRYGESLGQRFTPVDAVGVYIPGGVGGQTPLVSTLLMNVIPAQIAGVEKIVVMTPPAKLSDGVVGVNIHLSYALLQLGIEKIYLSGGAQAVAAMAYGTETVPSVDMIVGPGNRYVNAAKKKVFGKVMIDALSGHSEIVIWTDGKKLRPRPDWVAADLLSQAEHAGGELTILVIEDEEYGHMVINEVNRQMEMRERKDLIRSSLNKRGAVILVDNPDQAVEVINYIAPEHIEILYPLPLAKEYAQRIKHAGAIFIGDYASEPIGDYICGTNHVLPTNRSARFSSPLGVYTFLKRTNIIHYNESAFAAYSNSAAIMAEVEQLTAHKYALEIRKDNSKN